MKHMVRKTTAILLALILLFQAGEIGFSSAAEEIHRALNPTEEIDLTVPEAFADGNWFFFAETDYIVSEHSTDPLYIPIQRSGDLSQAADVVLKITDVTAKHDVNYTVELYKDATEPEIKYEDMSIKDIALNGDVQEEFQLTDENELGEMIYEAGGAEIVDGEGNVVGTVTAVPEGEAAEAGAAEDETSAQTQSADPAAAQTGTSDLIGARNAFTDTVSDRQELEGSDLGSLASFDPNVMTEEEYNQAMADAVADDYPGKEYALHFEAGEEAKFLVITPMYSDAAEGDAQLILMLKTPSEGYAIGENVNPVSVTVLDEDEPEPVTISMIAETVTAENGKAKITVTRDGRFNAIKGVMISSWDGTAKEGDEYSGIGAKLWFPMGVRSRTVEIPVYHGAEQKDFYVSITPLSDETVETATIRVVIPAADAKSDGDGDGELMTLSDANGHPFTDTIDLTKAGYFDKGTWSGDGLMMKTSTDKEETTHYWFDASQFGYAYDGVYVDYATHMSFCDAEFRLVRWSGGSWSRMDTDRFTSDGWHYGQHLSTAWNAPKPTETYSIENANVDNEGAVWDDSWTEMWLSVRLIKRQFTVEVETPEVLPLLGYTDQEVLTNFEGVYLSGMQYSSQDLWTDDAFSLMVKNEDGPLRLAGVEAKSTDGKWVRIVTLDGKSQLASITMNAATVNALGEKNLLSWSKNGSWSHGGDFYKGTLTVRPVFEYQDVTMQLKQSSYGELYMTAPNPNLLWDFNSDNAMSSKMGTSWDSDVKPSGSNHRPPGPIRRKKRGAPSGFRRVSGVSGF